MFFFGVPNRGLHITHLTNLCKGRKLVEDLGEDSQFLPSIHREFLRVFEFDDPKIYSIYETKDTKAVQVIFPPNLGTSVPRVHH